MSTDGTAAPAPGAAPAGEPEATVPASDHGAAPLRGLENVPRSSTETGRFGRLFRNLAPLRLDEAQLKAVADQMVDPGESGGTGAGWSGTPTSGDGGLAAGWTYFAQFVDHDITFDASSMLDRSNDPDSLENFRTPRFDLDSVYGLGPTANPWMYDNADSDKLLTSDVDAADLPRNHQGRALIGDPRNDVHVIISQLHKAFIDFHNQVVERVRQDPALVLDVPATPVPGYGQPVPTPGKPTFGQIVTLVRWHYQWLVLREFLPNIVGEETVAAIFKAKKGKLELYNVNRKPWMPVEFSAAAYRFGHSLVRDAYQLNAGLSPLPIFSADPDPNTRADLRGFRALPGGWAIEWRRFFDGLDGDASQTHRARAFDTKIAGPLHHLPPKVDAQQRSLALLNLMRGVALDLPSGEDVAAVVASAIGIDTATAQGTSTLGHPTPLWFWFLQEAERNGGQHLGPIGGRIVAEVLVGLAANDRSSFLRARPDWTPSLGSNATFTIADLLRVGGATS